MAISAPAEGSFRRMTTTPVACISGSRKADVRQDGEKTLGGRSFCQTFVSFQTRIVTLRDTLVTSTAKK